ncbi:MAG: hypothetical protein K8L91_01995 [Anaerolineae bacterium]|nr:hypothetical protein [Anaerolineae bacterium]
MGRVLRIGAGVMGVLLVVMTVGLWILRRVESTTDLMLVKEIKITQSSSGPIGSDRLAIEASNGKYDKPLTPFFYYSYPDPIWTRDGQWGYFVGYETATSKPAIYRLKSDGCCFERVVDSMGKYDFSRISVSPNGEWLGVNSINRQTQTNPTLLLIHLPSQKIRDLGEEVLRPIMESGQFSWDSERFGFSAVMEENDPTNNVWDVVHHFQLSLSTGQLEDFDLKYGGWVYPNMYLEEDLVVVKGLHRHFHINRDGSNPDFYIQLAHGEILPSGYEEYLEAWLPSHNLLILSSQTSWDRQKLWGFPLEGGAPYWTLENVQFTGVSRDGELIFLQGWNGVLYNMPAKGGNLETVGELAIIYRSHLSIFDWSKAGNWVLTEFIDFMTSNPIVWDNSRNLKTRQPSTYSEGSHFLQWFTPPTKPSQPVLLLIVGMGLIGISIFGKRPFHLFRQRRRPAA